VKLVTGHPVSAPPRVDRRDNRRRELPPLRAGEAIHEQRDAHVVALRERRDQLARIDLETAHLLWGEEEQVEAHVHARPA
jgi:hypothetical protein